MRIVLFDRIERGHLEGYIAFCAVDRQTVETALGLGLKDFEDSIQLACATIDRLDGIVTRDRKDFIGSNLPIYSPTELLNQL